MADSIVLNINVNIIQTIQSVVYAYVSRDKYKKKNQKNITIKIIDIKGVSESSVNLRNSKTNYVLIHFMI